MVLLSCPSTGTTAKASSVLNQDGKQYGAKHALDTTNESSSWYSDGQADGDTSHVFTVNFHRTVSSITSISLLFQGGFVPEECQFYTIPSTNDSEGSSGKSVMWNEIKDAYIEPENENTMQEFDLTECEDQQLLKNCTGVRFVFRSSTDFYGRIILYKLEVHGEE